MNKLQLAKAIGVSHVAIANFLNGQLPRSAHLASLADFFGVRTDWLLGRDNDDPSTMHLKSKGRLEENALAELKTVKEKVESLERSLIQLKAHADIGD